jgi:hypothetical protein
VEAVDVSRGENAEDQLNRFIDHRARQSGEERPEEASWKESVRVYNLAREAERRAAWCSYHKGQAKRLKRVLKNLVEFHEDKARQLSSETNGRKTA